MTVFSINSTRSKILGLKEGHDALGDGSLISHLFEFNGYITVEINDVRNAV